MRRSPIKPSNRKRRAKMHVRNFGVEAETVRGMPCLCWRSKDAFTWGDESHLCVGPVAAAHVTARGMGASKGGRFDLVPLCSSHHGEASEAGTSQREAFEERYGIDLRAEADRIATPGIAGLAQRWVEVQDRANEVLYGQSLICEAVDSMDAVALDTYERDALLGWVRRRMKRERGGCREGGVLWTWESAADSVAKALGLYDDDSPVGGVADGGRRCYLRDAVAICELAGWPS